MYISAVKIRAVEIVWIIIFINIGRGNVGCHDVHKIWVSGRQGYPLYGSNTEKFLRRSRISEISCQCIQECRPVNAGYRLLTNGMTNNEISSSRNTKIVRATRISSNLYSVAC